MTHIDLFTGMGGFALAAKWAGFETVAMCEINEKLRGFLETEWRVPVHDDIKTFDGRQWAGATLLSAGVPCQPASLAGKRRGAEDSRWLWPEALRVTAEVRPDWAIFENPPGILSMGIDGILAELESIGYEVGLVDIPACAVDSPQLRHRIWIVAHRTEPGSQGAESARGTRADRCAPEYAERGDVGNGSSQRSTWVGIPVQQGRSRQTNPDANGSGAGELADGEGEQNDERRFRDMGEATGRGGGSYPTAGGVIGELADGAGGRPQAVATGDKRRESEESARDVPRWSDYEWIACGDGKVRRTKPGLGGLVNGLPARVRRPALEALGNAIVPQVAYQIMLAIAEAGWGKE